MKHHHGHTKHLPDKEDECAVCGDYADFNSPAMLCPKHWRAWWDGEFEVEDRKVIKPKKTK